MNCEQYVNDIGSQIVHAQAFSGCDAEHCSHCMSVLQMEDELQGKISENMQLKMQVCVVTSSSPSLTALIPPLSCITFACG